MVSFFLSRQLETDTFVLSILVYCFYWHLMTHVFILE